MSPAALVIKVRMISNLLIDEGPRADGSRNDPNRYMAAVVAVSGAAVDEHREQESVGEPAEPGDVHRPRRR